MTLSALRFAKIFADTVPQPYLILDCDMGEAPFFEEDINTLRFLDIHKQHVHTVNLTKGPSSHRLLAEPDIAFS